MSDLISRKVLLDSLEKEQQIYEDNCSSPSFWTALSVVRHMPPVEAKEVVHGEWVSDLDENGKLNSVWRKCSVCGCLNHSTKPNFCPNCGADVRTSAE